MKMILTNAAVS